ncbi:MAG: S8 family peptidase [Lysobacteraceae bacterium]|nr:MAG: S8 family peptidase [Xanthomonadaceae bacterium]
MKRRTSVIVVGALVAVSSAASSVVSAADLITAANPVEGQYIVVLKPEAARLAGENGRAAAVAEMAGRIAAQHRLGLAESYEHVLRGFSVKADDAALARLLADPRVAYVEENGVVEAMAAPWGLDRIDQRFLPLNGTYLPNRSGAGVHAYIVDTGINLLHTEFTGRIGNGFDAIGGGLNDCNGHGSNVAAVVGGTTWGVAKKVTLHPVRVLNCVGSGTTAQVISGLNWIAANHIRPAVANISLGGGASTALDTAVTQLIGAGVSVVAAAGSGGANACNFSPGRVLAAITVSATDRTDTRVASANYGTCLDVFAPGKDIPSISGIVAGGTSMAAPHATGAAALYLQGNPAATPAAVSNAITVNATPGVVINPGLGSPNRLLYIGNF